MRTMWHPRHFSANEHFNIVDLWCFFSSFNIYFPKQGHMLLLLVIEKRCVCVYIVSVQCTHVNVSPKFYLCMQSMSYCIDGTIASAHRTHAQTEKKIDIYSRTRTFILMSFSPFHLTKFVPHDFFIPWKFILFCSLPFLFFRSHIIITVTRCLFIFFTSLPFFTFYFFLCAFILLSFFLLAAKCVRRTKNRQRGRHIKVCRQGIRMHTRTFDFYIVENFSVNTIVRWKKYECAKWQ